MSHGQNIGICSYSQGWVPASITSACNYVGDNVMLCWVIDGLIWYGLRLLLSRPFNLNHIGVKLNTYTLWIFLTITMDYFRTIVSLIRTPHLDRFNPFSFKKYYKLYWHDLCTLFFFNHFNAMFSLLTKGDWTWYWNEWFENCCRFQWVA
jgi:hypothetical protein